jgi:nicotinate-nucleotide adenylyltransferase
LERQLNVSQALNKKLESKISSDFDDFFSSHGKILILKNDMINISSTDVRLKIKNNENLTGLVDEEVLKYILNESLYKI